MAISSTINLRRRPLGFTLLEILVSSAVFVIILTLVAGIMSSACSLWLRHRNQSVAFEAANTAFDTLTRSLAQAVLNTYWEVNGSRYGRASELHFTMGTSADLLGPISAATYPGQAVFFQAPLGRSTDPNLKRLPLLLNNIGYFVRFDGGPTLPTFLNSFVKARQRYRLYEWLEPTENLGVYAPPDNTANGLRAWFRDDLASGNMANTAVLAENVIGLVFMAEYPDASNQIVSTYSYDSRDASQPGSLHQLPPRIRVLMAVIDEASATRLAGEHGNSEPPVHPDPKWFQDPAKFDADLNEWEKQLKEIQPPVEYRIFTATVVIQNAKWSLSL